MFLKSAMGCLLECNPQWHVCTIMKYKWLCLNQHAVGLGLVIRTLQSYLTQKTTAFMRRSDSDLDVILEIWVHCILPRYLVVNFSKLIANVTQDASLSQPCKEPWHVCAPWHAMRYCTCSLVHGSLEALAENSSHPRKQLKQLLSRWLKHSGKVCLDK